MRVAAARITLRMPENGSLKDKRRLVASLKARVRNKHNVSIAEVDDLESWRNATLGVSAVSNSTRHVEAMIDSVLDFIEATTPDSYVSHVERDILPSL